MKRELVLTTSGPHDTRRLAATIAGALRVGDVVSLTGELGAGKTCFVQGAAASLGVADRVTSPTFLLRREYAGRLPIVHLDVYRLDTLQEAAELGLDDVGRCVTFIEWGDAMQPLLPADHLEIEFSSLPEPPAAGTGPDPDATNAAARSTATASRAVPDHVDVADRADADTADGPDAGPADGEDAAATADRVNHADGAHRVGAAADPIHLDGADHGGPLADGDELRRVVLRPRGADWRRRIVSLAVDCGPWRSDGGPTGLDAMEL